MIERLITTHMGKQPCSREEVRAIRILLGFLSLIVSIVLLAVLFVVFLQYLYVINNVKSCVFHFCFGDFLLFGFAFALVVFTAFLVLVLKHFRLWGYLTRKEEEEIRTLLPQNMAVAHYWKETVLMKRPFCVWEMKKLLGKNIKAGYMRGKRNV